MSCFKMIFATLMSFSMLLALSSTAAETSAKTQTSVVKVAKDPRLGEILTDSKGMTLYIFTG